MIEQNWQFFFWTSLSFRTPVSSELHIRIIFTQVLNQMIHTYKAGIDCEKFISVCVLLLLMALDWEILLISSFYQIPDSSKVLKGAIFYHDFQTKFSPQMLTWISILVPKRRFWTFARVFDCISTSQISSDESFIVRNSRKFSILLIQLLSDHWFLRN